MFDRLEAYRIMLLSRCFEQKVHSLFSRGELYGTTHLNIGQEASHTGLCLALGDEDWIVPTHRCHGFNVARGSSISAMFSELYGSRHGLCRGIGGSMHMTDLKTRNFGSSAVVGSSVALATGIAYALSRQGKKAIAAAILGDGATSRGVVHESMNLASVWSLPVLFFCENNHYGMSASAQRMISTGDIAGRASCYGIRAFHADGNVLDDVYAAVSEARRYILENNEPAFIEVDTYRQCGHSKSDKCVYRSGEEEKAWAQHDPIALFEKTLGLDDESLATLRREAEESVERAHHEAFLHRNEIISQEELDSYVYAPSPEVKTRIGSTHPATYRQAVREALSEILSSDDRATVIGEDVGLYGGCFQVTQGLEAHYSDKIMETPVSEEAFTTMAAAAAAMGEHPIVEIMYGDFCTLASDGLVNHAAKLRYMSAGQLSCPMVLRTPMGGGTGHGSQHTQCLEAMFLNVPGLKIVAPSDPFTAKALLKAAVRDPNPVLFLEHKALYDSAGETGDALSSWPIGKAQVLRSGSSLTLISYSHSTLTCRKALSETGLDVEHIDLVSLKPLDWDTVSASARKTGRVLIVQDTPPDGSVAATVACRLAGDPSVSCTVRMLCAKDRPIPFSRTLERDSLPTVEEVLQALYEMLA